MSLWAEGGPSTDTYSWLQNGENGYALAGGIALGRTLAFTIGAGFEHYPSDGEPTSGIVLTPGGSVPYLRVGGGNKRVATLGAGLRLTIAHHRVQPMIDASLGWAKVTGERMRYVDATTGDFLDPYPPRDYAWSGIMGELGLGLRSNRGQRLDGLIGVRWRQYTQGFEGSAGSSFQVRVGLISGNRVHSEPGGER